ncbi:unnamed protein product [Zymoseptoria tritici ST99CH_1A5]|uniref:Glycine zipper 2TM domain-containing protein n=2 Tax=Zymoseptoria tritici TaxID=1047171 RepID=A0A2H1GBZ0_ZYMTR|nr:unnamed protein product [Zymoseptoria tritici ST99CH_1E4]SMR51997.1 unnamed protein product [Zymoseptoria tritici ST99CH_3D1]SMY23750.1 unnamed protein product [Zymoseptoria tritici ST99CH_1A5]
MAAAEYFNPGSQPASYSGALRPPMNANLALPYPISDAPPPYTAIADARPHSQPPPIQRPPPLDPYYQQPPANGQQYPPGDQQYPPYNQQYPPNGAQYPQNGVQYPSSGQHHPAEKASRPQPQAQYRPQSYTPQPQQGYFSQPGPSSMKQSFTRKDRDYGAASPHVQFRTDSPRVRSRSRSRSRSRDRRERERDRDRDRSRSRSRSRERRHRHRQQPSQKKKSGVDTFIGAGGGALIGDAIFPGLGTIGGAILGGLGGHKVAKDKERERRVHSNPNGFRNRSYSNDGDYYYADEYNRRGRKY